MKKQNAYCLGQHAEMRALRFFLKAGLTLVQKNYRCYVGEIDLIMQDRDDIIFIEVRMRSRLDYGTALESITRAKQRKLTKAAIHFLQMKKWLYKINSRFDVLIIQGNNDTHIEWIKHAFEGPTYL